MNGSDPTAKDRVWAGVPRATRSISIWPIRMNRVRQAFEPTIRRAFHLYWRWARGVLRPGSWKNQVRTFERISHGHGALSQGEDWRARAEARNADARIRL